MADELPDLPALDDMRELLRFEPEEGRIWMAQERMVLLRSSELRALRRELIESLGIDRAKGLLIRMGYVAGQQDAETARRLRPDAPMFDVFSVGPQSHMLTGQVKVTPIELELDDETGAFQGVFEWENSFEAEIYIAEYGVSHEPVCWTQIGYASGFTSRFVGRQILFKEQDCAGCGDRKCRIEGRPVEQWEDSEELLSYYRPDRIADKLFALQTEVGVLRDNLVEEQQFGNLIGSAPRFLEVNELIAKASESRVTVLLLGETGVGKDMFAKTLHERSPRRNNPFVAVNCAAIPKDLIEAELFGVEKGAYTGADQSRPGRFERAHGGTLFLDEVGELSTQAQAALLRVLQENELERVGDTRTRKVDVRLVAATNEDLDLAVAQGRFRADLLYRLNVYSVTVPPLRERIEDVPVLVAHFVEKYSLLHGKPVQPPTDEAMDMLSAYPWPGNIRELGNMIERGIILAEQGSPIQAEHLFPLTGKIPTTSETCAPSGAQRRSREELLQDILEEGCGLEELEQALFSAALERSKGNVTRAAELLGLSRATLDYRLKKQRS